MLDTLNLQRLNWTAEVRPLFNADGTEFPEQLARGVYRDDTGQPIARCGPSTTVIQHGDVIYPILEKIADTGIDILERDYARHDLYDLQGKKGGFVALDMARDGAIARARIITGDFISPTGPSAYLPDGPPTLFREYHVLNSHDSTYAQQVHLRYLNAKCMNGLVTPEFTAVVKAKHSLNFDIEAFKAKVLAGVDLMENDTERFELYIKTPLDAAAAETFFKKTIARLKPKDDGEPNWSKAKLEDLLNRFREEPQTVWGAYQAMTAWATHADIRSNATELTSRIGRDEEVARSMRTGEFRQLLAA